VFEKALLIHRVRKKRGRDLSLRKLGPQAGGGKESYPGTEGFGCEFVNLMRETEVSGERNSRLRFKN